MLWSHLLCFMRRESLYWIKRSLSTRLTCPLSSRRNKEESSGDSPGTSLSTEPLCRMRVHSFQSWRSHRDALSSGSSRQPCHTSQLCHRFWCWIDSVLLLRCYSMCVCVCLSMILVLGSILCFSVCCLRFSVCSCVSLSSLSVFVYSGRWLVPDHLHVTSDVEEQCCFWHWLLVGRRVCLSAELRAKLTVYSEGRRFCLKPVAGLRGGTECSISGCMIKI